LGKLEPKKNEQWELGPGQYGSYKDGGYAEGVAQENTAAIR